MRLRPGPHPSPRRIRRDNRPGNRTELGAQLRSDLRRVTAAAPDLPRQLARRPDFRRALLCGVAAVTVAVAGSVLGDLHAPAWHRRLVAAGCAAGFAVLGVLTVRSVAGEVGRLVDARGTGNASSVTRVLLAVTGYLVVALLVLGLLRVPLGHLLVGGAVTGVILGIAAQQSLGNVFAGAVLLLNRPFTVGDRIRVRSGALGGEVTGTVAGMSLTYVSLDTDDGALLIPNAGLLAAAVGPHRPRARQEMAAAGDHQPAAGAAPRPEAGP